MPPYLEAPRAFGDYRQPYRSRMKYRNKRRKPKPRSRRSLIPLIQSVVDAELKVADFAATVEVNFPLGINTTLTGNIGQGELNTERSGNWIKPVKLYGTFYVTGNTDNTALSTNYRLIVYCWKEDESINDASLFKVMADTSDPFQGFNIINKGQFQILYTHTDEVSNSDFNGRNSKIHKFSIPSSRMSKVLYAMDVEKKNQIFIAANSGVSLDGPIIGFTTRLRYTDS